MGNKYNDRYDESLYISKGYILPDGLMLTKEYARFHEDMAKRYIEENYYTSYKNDFIKDYKDYMLMRVHALQVLSCGKHKILYCDDHLSKKVIDAIVSYKSFGWEEIIIPNPSASYYNYMRYHIDITNSYGLYFGGDCYEEEIDKYISVTGLGSEKEEETPKVVTPEPTQPETTTEEPKVEEKKSTNVNGIMAIVLILALAGAGGYMYFNTTKNSKKKQAQPDPDGEYSEDYLSSLPKETEEEVDVPDTDDSDIRKAEIQEVENDE